MVLQITNELASENFQTYSRRKWQIYRWDKLIATMAKIYYIRLLLLKLT